MTQTPPERILIVDDEASYRLMLRGLLEKKGFRVLEAEEGQAGVDLAKEHHPDLILMDVHMPKLKGSDAVRILKADPKVAEIPIIVVSAREDSQDLLNSFAWGASDYVRKVFHHEELLARIRTHLSINRLRRQLVKTNERLRNANESLRHDLHYAGEIQKSILAQRLPEVEDVRFASRYVPCEETSGDHYSAFWLDEDNLGICVADASGHGVGAAMLAVFLKGQLEYISRRAPTPNGDIRRPAEVLEIINRSLCNKEFGREFISAVYGVLHLPTMTFRFANAGHPYPLLIESDGTTRELETHNTVLGIFPDSTFEDEEVRLQPGFTLFLYTDGLIEARRPGGDQFGIERLVHALGLGLGLAPDMLAERVMDAVATFREGFALEDDLTFLAVTHTG
jgi:sigma-B regulation protein RsbU (phosphoserine phosphatase)